MAKKKKYENMKLEQNELVPIAIGSFGNKKKSSIGAFIIITLFILVVVFLPEITDYVNKLLNHPTNYSNPSISNPNPSNPEEGESISSSGNDEFYAFESGLKIERDEIILSDFSVNAESSLITFNVTNKRDSYVNVDALNYFLEIYNKDQVLIERVKLGNELNLSNNETKKIERNISSEALNNIHLLVLVKKNTSDYPNVVLNTNEDNTSTLVCTRLSEKVTYKFTQNLLKELTHEYSYNKENTDYESKYNDFKNLSNSYNNKKGITSTFFEYDSGFNITTLVNLEEAARTYIFLSDTYELDTEPKIVKFEMEAQNFKCS